jgi:hypothetical protein
MDLGSGLNIVQIQVEHHSFWRRTIYKPRSVEIKRRVKVLAGFSTPLPASGETFAFEWRKTAQL